MIRAIRGMVPLRQRPMTTDNLATAGEESTEFTALESFSQSEDA